MGIRDHRDLIAWQLANELKLEVYRFTARNPAARDRKFCEQVRDAVSSVTSNTTEGFYRFRHREFAYFLRIARSSLGETQNHLQDARDRRYLEETEFGRLWRLSKRTSVATSRLMTYLRRTSDPPEPARPRGVKQ